MADEETTNTETESTGTEQEQSGAGPPDLSAELERTRAALKAANREAADRRKKLEAYEQAEADRQQAEMTELDKAKKLAEEADRRAQQAESKARDTLIRAAFMAEAAKAGVAHPEDVYLLADRSAVEIDDAGAVAGVAEAVKTLVDAGRVPLAGKPQAPNLDGAKGGAKKSDTGGSPGLTEDELAAARRMGVSPEAYVKFRSSQDE